jgi:hypothetical protein
LTRLHIAASGSLTTRPAIGWLRRLPRFHKPSQQQKHNRDDETIFAPAVETIEGHLSLARLGPFDSYYSYYLLVAVVVVVSLTRSVFVVVVAEVVVVLV